MDSPKQEVYHLYNTDTPSSMSPDKVSLRPKRDGWTRLLVLAAVSTTLGSAVPFGYNIGVINTPAPLIQQWCNQSLASYSLTPAGLDMLWSTIVSAFLVGGMIGSFAGSWSADYVGRKGALVVSDILGCLSAVMFFVSKPMSSVTCLLLARFVVGLSSGTADLWHYLLSLHLVLILVSATALPTLPESPKYLYIVRGLRQRALKELSRLRGYPAEEVAHELELGEGRGDTRGEWGVASLLSTPSMRLPLALVCALQAGQQCSGINAVFYYSTRIFQSAGMSQTGAQYANLGAGVINFSMSAAMIPVVNSCKRRSLLHFSLIPTTITLVLLPLSISFSDAVSWMPNFSIFCVLFYVLVYGCGLGPIPYFIGSELFDVGPRAPAMALGSVAQWIGNLTVGMTFPILQRLWGQNCFYLFAASTAALTVFIHLKLPETFTPRQAVRATGSEKRPLSKQVTSA
ncbi:solute carrier family 2, facilitated glucose transporter member 4-like isoform X2 [Homalodisca vitripennis]|uniref:solute carrier family 2, facilitated glucose transporter member 4-like isoform X2 n=1 Tax=Homalodisca vitripennis TaxID=197043 RepID=UPI001EEB6E00|nr:solute carrier family 2, facilitated glucose transporter member 4-like isoform X2 [Homalodisca vitripennis]